MNKYIKTITISALFLSFVAIAPAFVQAQVNGDDDTVAPAPSETLVSNGDDETAGSSANTDVAMNGSDDTTGSAASTGGSNTGTSGNGDDDTSGSPASTGGTNTGGTSNGDDDTSGSVPSTPSNPSNPSNGGGGNGGSGSSSRNAGSSSGSNLPLLTNIGNCSYINDYMKLDGTNSVAEVTKLQTFFKNTEKLDVDINGKFDQKTFDAVKAFQAKYVNEIMAPWGVNTPTGQVFYTTKKKINEIYCKSTFALTPAQIAQIEAYRKGLVDGTIEVDANGSEINATGTIPLLPEVGSAESSQTASVAGFGTRIWNFVKWLFGY